MATARKRPHMFFLATPENRQPNRKAKCAIQIQTPESGHALSPVNSSSTSETLHETESQSESGSTPVLMEAKHSLNKTFGTDSLGKEPCGLLGPAVFLC